MNIFNKNKNKMVRINEKVIFGLKKYKDRFFPSIEENLYFFYIAQYNVTKQNVLKNLKELQIKVLDIGNKKYMILSILRFDAMKKKLNIMEDNFKKMGKEFTSLKGWYTHVRDKLENQIEYTKTYSSNNTFKSCYISKDLNILQENNINMNFSNTISKDDYFVYGLKDDQKLLKFTKFKEDRLKLFMNNNKPSLPPPMKINYVSEEKVKVEDKKISEKKKRAVELIDANNLINKKPKIILLDPFHKDSIPIKSNNENKIQSQNNNNKQENNIDNMNNELNNSFNFDEPLPFIPELEEIYPKIDNGSKESQPQTEYISNISQEVEECDDIFTSNKNEEKTEKNIKEIRDISPIRNHKQIHKEIYTPRSPPPQIPSILEESSRVCKFNKTDHKAIFEFVLKHDKIAIQNHINSPIIEIYWQCRGLPMYYKIKKEKDYLKIEKKKFISIDQVIDHHIGPINTRINDILNHCHFVNSKEEKDIQKFLLENPYALSHDIKKGYFRIWLKDKVSLMINYCRISVDSSFFYLKLEDNKFLKFEKLYSLICHFYKQK